MRIFLVRHGESMGNLDKSVHLRTPDHAIPLSPRGHEQAAAAGAVLNELFTAERAASWTRSGQCLTIREDNHILPGAVMCSCALKESSGAWWETCGVPKSLLPVLRQMLDEYIRGIG